MFKHTASNLSKWVSVQLKMSKFETFSWKSGSTSLLDRPHTFRHEVDKGIGETVLTPHWRSYNSVASGLRGALVWCVALTDPSACTGALTARPSTKSRSLTMTARFQSRLACRRLEYRGLRFCSITSGNCSCILKLVPFNRRPYFRISYLSLKKENFATIGAGLLGAPW